MSGLFPAAFAAWVRESWPGKAALVAIDGKTSRRSGDRGRWDGEGETAPLHLVSAFATTARLVLAQEAAPDKGSELAAIPLLLDRLGAEDGLKGALVSIDAVAANARIAAAITGKGADWLLAVKASRRSAPRSRPPSPPPSPRRAWRTGRTAGSAGRSTPCLPARRATASTLRFVVCALTSPSVS